MAGGAEAAGGGHWSIASADAAAARARSIRCRRTQPHDGVSAAGTLKHAFAARVSPAPQPISIFGRWGLYEGIKNLRDLYRGSGAGEADSSESTEITRVR